MYTNVAICFLNGLNMEPKTHLCLMFWPSKYQLSQEKNCERSWADQILCVQVLMHPFMFHTLFHSHRSSSTSSTWAVGHLLRSSAHSSPLKFQSLSLTFHRKRNRFSPRSFSRNEPDTFQRSGPRWLHVFICTLFKLGSSNPWIFPNAKLNKI